MTEDKPDGVTKHPNGMTERLAESTWLKALERLAIPLMVVALAWFGSTLNSLQISVTEVRTAQQEAIVPGVDNLNHQINNITKKMLEHKWFGRDDAERLDDQHRALIGDHDNRLREIEKRAGHIHE